MSEGYIEKRRFLQELPFISCLTWEARQMIRKKIEEMPEVSLLKRDEGMEPILEEGSTVVHESRADGTSGFVSRPYLDWKCPVCGWFVGELYCGHGRWHIQQERSYCSRCGQKIDWTKPLDEEKTRYETRKAEERKEFKKANGIRLDNMHESLRRKYGMLNEEDPDNGAESADS